MLWCVCWSSVPPSFFLHPSCFIICAPSLSDVNPDQPIRNGGEDRQREGEAGVEEQERLGLPLLSLATPRPVRASSPSPSASLLLFPQGRREGEVLVVDAAVTTSRARAAASNPPPLLYSHSTPALEEEAAHHGGFRAQQALVFGRGSSPGPLLGFRSPMEPLPTQGQALRHFTASRPRPRRTQTPLPSSRPQVRTQTHI